MINWFFKWVGNKIISANRDTDNYPEDAMETMPTIASSKHRNRVTAVRDNRDTLDSEPITFKMYKASGGWAIEFRHYDSKNDRIDHSLYVVNGEEELGNHISQIITMEALKR